MWARFHPVVSWTMPQRYEPEASRETRGAASSAQGLRGSKGRSRGSSWRDASLVCIATGVAAILCAQFNVAELLRRWSAPWEQLQLDELPVVLLTLAAGLSWFAVRRYREADRQIDRREIAEAQLEAALEDNRRLSQQYVELQEAERKSLARELHDELGQYLNVIKLDAVGIRDRRSANAEALSERAGAIVVNCNHIHAALADLIRQLRPVGLDELGLAAALEHCIEAWRGRLSGASLQLSLSGDLSGLPESIALTLYRLVQEGLTNVVKHAAARHISVRLDVEKPDEANPETIHLTVVDDGQGTRLAVPTRGLGLIGMRERVAALEGELTVNSSPGKGFELRARIPIRRSSLPAT
jgi:two-component system, NarL family, sensor histidine kinase UhpB